MHEWNWRRCQSLRFSRDTVLYEEDPKLAAPLIAKRGGYHPPQWPLFNGPWYPNPPPEWGPPAEFFPPCLAAIDKTPPSSLGGRPWQAFFFLHPRRDAGGPSRLVAVALAQTALGPDGHEVFIGGRVIEKGSPATGINRYAGEGRLLHIPLLGLQRLRLYAGQPDPADASHFTIRYAIDGVEGMMDGWIREVCPTEAVRPGKPSRPWVELKIRDGPGTASVEYSPPIPGRPNPRPAPSTVRTDFPLHYPTPPRHAERAMNGE
jgi:hypothetical protein